MTTRDNVGGATHHVVEGGIGLVLIAGFVAGLAGMLGVTTKTVGGAIIQLGAGRGDGIRFGFGGGGVSGRGSRDDGHAHEGGVGSGGRWNAVSSLFGGHLLEAAFVFFVEMSDEIGKDDTVRIRLVIPFVDGIFEDAG